MSDSDRVRGLSPSPSPRFNKQPLSVCKPMDTGEETCVYHNAKAIGCGLNVGNPTSMPHHLHLTNNITPKCGGSSSSATSSKSSSFSNSESGTSSFSKTSSGTSSTGTSSAALI
ncbi:hypothetical protein LXL04_031574 [Taraxacum kok-saghyz]